MIPYFQQPSFGPIHAFGALVAIGVLLGAWILGKRAEKLGLDAALANRLVTWVVLPGFIGAHLVDRFIYYPSETLANPITIVKFWEGISSFGGFLGGAIGGFVFLRREQLRGAELMRYLDLVAYALPFGWIFGRIGCFVAFDHPGIPTDFFLAQADRDGIVRYNLGLLEAIYTVPMAFGLAALGRKPRPPGFFVGWLPILYAPVRFGLDFLRLKDVRYFGLRPAQYGAVAAIVLGFVVLRRAYSKWSAEPSDGEPRAKVVRTKSTRAEV